MKLTQDAVVLGAICHVLNRLRSIDQRLTSLQETVDCVVDILDEEAEYDADADDDIDTIAESIEAAAEDIAASGDTIPNRDAVASRLRDIVESIREEAGE